MENFMMYLISEFERFFSSLCNEEKLVDPREAHSDKVDDVGGAGERLVRRLVVLWRPVDHVFLKRIGDQQKQQNFLLHRLW